MNNFESMHAKKTTQSVLKFEKNVLKRGCLLPLSKRASIFKRMPAESESSQRPTLRGHCCGATTHEGGATCWGEIALSVIGNDTGDIGKSRGAGRKAVLN